MPYSYRPSHVTSRPSGRALKGELLLDERARRRRRRMRWRRIAIVVGLLTALAGLWGLYRSPLLRVHQVEVVGAEHIDPQQVIELAGVEGAGMLNPPLREAEREIAALPLVKTVKAERVWPQTIRIQVTEREPWGYWLAGGTAYVIDSEGVVLPGIEPSPGAPVIEALDAKASLEPGERVDAEAVALARALLERVPRELSVGIAGFTYSTQDGLSLTTDAGYRVVLGDSQNVDYKLAIWRALDGQMGQEAMSGHVLDLRFHNRPSFQ